MLRSASCSGSKQTGLCIFFSENVNAMSNLENWNSWHTTHVECIEPKLFWGQHDFSTGRSLKETIHRSVFALYHLSHCTWSTLDTPGYLHLTREHSLPDQVTILSTIPIIVVKCLLVLLLLQMLHAYSFFPFVWKAIVSKLGGIQIIP